MPDSSTGKNLYDVIRIVAQEAGGRTAIKFARRHVDYASLFTAADHIAVELIASGARAGDRISFLARNCPEILELYLAVAKIGAILVPINPELAPGEIAYVIGHSEPVVVYCDEGCRPQLQLALTQCTHRPEIRALATTNSRDIAPSCVGGAAPCVGGGADGLVICYTSGSTGRPKGILASHQVEIASAEAYRSIWHIGPTDRMLIALPLAYLYGLTTAGLTALTAGASILLLERFHPAAVTDAIEHEGATIFMGVPTMFAMLADYAESTGRSISAPGFRLPISAGAPLSAAIARRFTAAFGVDIQEFYALSEIRPVFAFDGNSQEVRPAGSVGRKAPGVEAKLIGENGKPLGPDEEGDLLVRSPTLMLGYYRDPDLTDAVMRDGWFRTGDRAKVDSQGRYYITGRVKEMIIRGGAKIAPAEVEAALIRHPDIREAAVVGVPDPVFGETVMAVVVARPGRRPSVEDVRTHCAGVLAPFKVPTQIVFRDALPVGPTGKVLKRALIDGA